MTAYQLSDLSSTGTAADADEMLLRKGLTDYRVAVSVIRNISISTLPSLSPDYAVASDYLIINRTILGVPTNFKITYGQVGFPINTKMWFYNTTPPPNWSVVANTGDRLLAVSDSVFKYNGVSAGAGTGTWQQTDVTLTIDQIPAHSHTFRAFDHSTSQNTTHPAAGKDTSTTTVTTSTVGGGQPHNHGNTWRPLANIGLIANKNT